MKYLGIDYGTKRIGIAISDSDGVFAFPNSIIENTKKDAQVFSTLLNIIEKENIKKIILGESLDYGGKQNKIMKEIKKFSEKIQKEFSLPVHFEKEFLTSVEARRYKDNKREADASASALILQRYLDRINK